MSDKPREFKNLSLSATHTPEVHRTRNSDGSVDEVTLPGDVQVFLEFDGGKVPLAHFKGAQVLEAIDAAKEAKGAKKSGDEPAPEANTEAE